MEIKVEKSVPVPSYGKTKYPFDELTEVGFSFLAHNKRDPCKQASISTQARFWALKNNKPWKFTARQVDEGIRIWRIE